MKNIMKKNIFTSIFIIGIFAISYFAPSTPFWNALNNLLTSVIASGVFALVSGLYISYFFVDPTDIAAKSTLLAEDIGRTLRAIASRAADYKIFVRTGRHFRAEILPMLIKQARENRRPIRVEVILLDLRDPGVCDRYADYRKASSFDRQLWDRPYVQKEILATILTLTRASHENRGLVDIHLFLSKRLSTFRIEGSSDEILVTREDPKDAASRYFRNHSDFAAFVTEFGWIRDEAFRVAKDEAGVLPATHQAMFGENAEISNLEFSAAEASSSPSPYAR